MTDRSGQRTYWHLLDAARKPGDYEIATSRLLYYTGPSGGPGRPDTPPRGFEVNVPLTAWYERYQAGSPFRAADWEAFADPRATTYARYTALQSTQEAFVDGLWAAIAGTDYDARLSPTWLAALERLLPPMRYPVHGLQMVAAYTGSMAPGGRIAVALAFQAGDELRRVHRLAERMAILRQAHPGFGDGARDAWQADPLWQGWREAIERLLVAYDWGEAFVALNLAIKPRFDALFTASLAQLARHHGDDVLERTLHSFAQDAHWHVAWSRALLAVADPGAHDAVQGWLATWDPLARRAVRATVEALPWASDDVAAAVEAACLAGRP